MASPSAVAYMEERSRTVIVHQNAVIDYDDILRLFTHRHTASLVKRQAAAFRQISREKRDGLLMSDIAPVCSVMQLGLDRRDQLDAEGNSTELFVKPMCALIRLFGLPFITKKAYEEFDNVESLSQIVSVLIRSLETDESELIHAVSQTVMSFLSQRERREFTLRCDLIKTSGLVEALVLCLQRNSGAIDTCLPVVTACRQIATIHSLTPLFDSNVFGVLIQLLERDFREPLVLEVVQLLWILFDQPAPKPTFRGGGRSVLLREKEPPLNGSVNSIQSFASLHSIDILSNLLRQTFTNGYRNIDKQVRNDLVVLLILIARVEAARKLVEETGMLSELIKHATQIEVEGVANAAATNNNGLSKIATVGLQKIRALRTNEQSPNGNGSYSLTQEFATSPEDFQFKLLVWSLVSAVCGDQACHAAIVSNGAPILQAALLYLDAADAYNIRAVQKTAAALQKQIKQNQAMTGATMNTHAAFGSETGAQQISLNPYQASATAVIAKLSYSQLLHLQENALSLLLSLVPSAYESFVQLEGLQRVLGFAVNIVANDGNCEEKKLNHRTAAVLQRRALAVLVRAAQTGVQRAAQCPVTVSNASVEALSFSRSANLSSTNNAAGNTEDASNSGPTSTISKPNAALQDLLSTEGDDAFAAVQAALASPAKAGLKSNASTGSLSRSNSASNSLLDGFSRTDSAHVLSVLLTLFNDPTKSPELRSDAITVASLLLSRNAALQKQFRQLKGVHILAQFLHNDGAKVAAGLGEGTMNGTTTNLSLPPTSGNLALYASKHAGFITAVVDALWSCVIGCRPSEEVFLALNGVDLILDLLLIVSPAGRKQILGFLSDLLVAPGAAQFVYEWRSGPNRTLPGVTAAPVTTTGAASGDGKDPAATTTSLEAIEGFSALELLLSFWPEATLVERHEAAHHGELTLTPAGDVTAREGGNDDVVNAEEEGFASDSDGGVEEAEARALEAHARVANTLSSLPRIASNLTLRPALYAVFARLGFGEDSPFLQRANAVQRAQLYSLSQYLDVVRRRALHAVGDRLQTEGVSLVQEDRALLEENELELASLDEHAKDFQREQWTVALAEDHAEIEQYLHRIVDRKVVSEQFLLQSARRARKQTMRRRLLYKEMRQQMLKNSNEQLARTSRQGKRPTPPLDANGKPLLIKASSSSSTASGKVDNNHNEEAKTQHDEDLNSSGDEGGLQGLNSDAEEEQRRRDEEDDAELENRLLNGLMEPIAPLTTTSTEDLLQQGAEEEQKYASTGSGSNSSKHLGGAGSGSNSTKQIVSQLDPDAERALLLARQAQKARQAAINAALASSSLPSSALASQRTSTTSLNSQRTNTSSVSQLNRPTK